MSGRYECHVRGRIEENQERVDWVPMSLEFRDLWADLDVRPGFTVVDASDYWGLLDFEMDVRVDSGAEMVAEVQLRVNQYLLERESLDWVLADVEMLWMRDLSEEIVLFTLPSEDDPF